MLNYYQVYFPIDSPLKILFFLIAITHEQLPEYISHLSTDESDS